MNKAHISLPILIFILLFLSLSCGMPELPGINDISLSSSKVLYQDDFSDENSGWEIGSYENGRVGYVNGEYQVIASSSRPDSRSSSARLHRSSEAA